MKVSELIEILKTVDPEMMVVVDGYEWGCQPPQRACETEIYLNAYEPDHCGEHVETKSGMADVEHKENCKKVKAFIISRNNYD